MVKIFLAGIYFLSFLLLLGNALTILTSPFHSIYNIVLISGIIVMSFFYGKKANCEKYYDYDQENPNALISGREVAGTVYASYPDILPGLGWIN